MSGRYRQSDEWYQRACAITPTGAQTLSRAAVRFPLGAFPTVAERGEGARLLTIDGQWMVDWIGSLGACPLGYGHRAVSESVIRQIQQGASFSLPHRLEIEVSERFCKVMGHESVRWVSTGSEACTGVMRTARSITGRSVIVTTDQSYHGWHDGFAASKDLRPGIPEVLVPLIRKFRYNDLDSLRIALAPGDVAAVLMEPTLWENPQAGFLEAVKGLAHQSGALFILDEMILALRMAVGGGSEYFRVKPDMACYGKSLANGLPIACFAGKREYLEHAWFVSGTFSGNALSLAAASAVLDVYAEQLIIPTMWRRGEELQIYFNGAAKSLNLPAVCDGYACKPRISFASMTGSVRKPIGSGPPYDSELIPMKELAMALFLQVAAAHGALFHPGGINVSAALTDEDMRVTKSAIDCALQAVQRSVTTGDWSALTGALCQPVVTVRQ